MGKPIKKILIVDDVKMMRLILKKGLAERGFEIIEAESGLEAIEKTNEENPDLVLLDINLNDMSGLQVLKSIKADHPDVEVIMITAYYELDLVNQALALGAAGYFHKPIDIDQLVEKIEELNQKAEEEKMGIPPADIKRALVIEPFAPIRLFLEKELASRGFTVLAKGSADEVEKQLSILKFEIAFVNANPSSHLTFSDVVAMIRDVNPEAKIIAIASPEGRNDREIAESSKLLKAKLISQGANFVLLKPFEEEEVKQLLDEMLSKDS